MEDFRGKRSCSETTQPQPSGAQRLTPGSGVRLPWGEVAFQTLRLPSKSCVTLI